MHRYEPGRMPGLAHAQPQALIPGTPGDDTLHGTAADDTLDGGAGKDLMIGGLGADTYYVNSRGDQVVEDNVNLFERDLVYARISYTLPDNVEDLTLTTTKDIDGHGNASDNVIDGNDGSNDLTGGGGNDTIASGHGPDELHGDAGDDMLLLQDSGLAYGGDGRDVLIGMTLSASYLLSGDAGDDILIAHVQFSGEATIDGGTGDDSLTSLEGNALLYGGDGNDTLTGNVQIWNALLDGGNGNDLIVGGRSTNHFYEHDTAADTLRGNIGDDVLFADWSAATENIVWTNDPNGTQVVFRNTVNGFDQLMLTLGAGNDYIDNTLAAAGWDVMDGGAGRDTLIGGGGADALTGGAAADLYVTDVADGTVDDVGGFKSGVDRIGLRSSVLPVGDGDARVEDATTIAGPGGFAAKAELVIVTTPIADDLSTMHAAAAIGSADSAYAAGRTAVFVVASGTASGVYYFESADGDAQVEADELTMLAKLWNAPVTTAGDFVLLH